MKRTKALRADPAKVREWKHRRTRLKPRSKKLAAAQRDYSADNKEFMAENPKCWIFPRLNSDDCHHIDGREGRRLLLSRDNRMAISRFAHDLIARFPQWARNLGYVSGPFRQLEPGRHPDYPDDNELNGQHIEDIYERIYGSKS